MRYLVTNQASAFKPHKYSICSVEESLKYLNNLEKVAYDSETTGFEALDGDTLLCIQMGDTNNQYVVDISTVNINVYKELLETKTLIMHNAKFDLRFLYVKGIFPTKIFDTLLAEKVLTNGILNHPRSLDACVYRYLKKHLDKSVRGNIHREGLSSRVIVYSAEDVAYLHTIMSKQLQLAKERDLYKAISLENRYVLTLAYIEYSGFYLDSSKWKIKCTEDNERKTNAEKALDAWLLNHADKYPEWINTAPQLDLFKEVNGPETTIKWTSSKQVVELFIKIGINTKVFDKDSGKIKDSIDAGVITPQKDKFDIIPLFLEFQSACKSVSTYGNNFFDFIASTTGRIHTEFNQLMETGRLSCGRKGNKKKRIKPKPNLQNIPSEERTRSCFTAQKSNYTLIVADYSGQEQIVLANFSKDRDLLKFYREGLGDMHSFVASKIFPELANLPLSEIKKKHKDKRQIAKAAGFAINYGGDGSTIADNLSISRAEGNKVYEAYFNAFPGLAKYFKNVQTKAIKNGYVTFNSVSNRKWYADNFHQWLENGRKFDGEYWENYRMHKDAQSEHFQNVLLPEVREHFKTKGAIERIALNYPIQGSSAEITKLAGIYLFKELRERELLDIVLMPNVVHDEILIECPKDMAEEMAALTKECMERAGEKFCTTIKLKAEPCITDHWTH